MNKQNDLKKSVAIEALSFIKPVISKDLIIGIGTGSTIDFFIEELSYVRKEFLGAVASSKRTELLLKRNGINFFDLNDIVDLKIYIDGADEIDKSLNMIKGGGGALTREKIVASVAKEFICIVDESKFVINSLGKFPVPIEIIPMAKSAVSLQLSLLGGNPVLREGFITDNGNYILDVHNLRIDNAIEMEKLINNIAGVVTCGLFAIRSADKLIMSTSHGIKYIDKL